MTIPFLDIFFSLVFFFFCVQIQAATQICTFRSCMSGFISLVKFSTFVFLFCFLYFFSLHFFIAIKSFLSYHSLTNTIVTQSPRVTKMDSLFVKRFVNS